MAVAMTSRMLLKSRKDSRDNTSNPAWDFSKALYAAAACDPDVLRAYTSVAALTAMPADVLAEPGMLDKVISVGSAAPRYSAPAPARAELLAAVGG